MAASGLQQEEKKSIDSVAEDPDLDEDGEENKTSPTESSRVATEKTFMEQYTQV